MSPSERTPAPAHGPTPRSNPKPNHRFSVLAAAEASVMSRTLELFAKRGVVPEQFGLWWVHIVLAAIGLAVMAAPHLVARLRYRS